MRLVLLSAVYTACCLAQIDVSTPATGLLVTNALVVSGKIIGVGISKDDALAILGSGTKTVSKLQQTTALKMIGENRLLAGDPLLHPLRDALDDVAEKCGVCWTELMERKIARNEVIRVYLVGAQRDQMKVALLILDKRRNVYDNMFQEVWQGVREIYLVDKAYRVIQDANGLRKETIENP